MIALPSRRNSHPQSCPVMLVLSPIHRNSQGNTVFIQKLFTEPSCYFVKPSLPISGIRWDLKAKEVSSSLSFVAIASHPLELLANWNSPQCAAGDIRWDIAAICGKVFDPMPRSTQWRS